MVLFKLKISIMSKRKGLLTKNQQKFFAILLADKIKFRNAILERLKKAAFILIISAVDDNLVGRQMTVTYIELNEIRHVFKR